MNKRILYFQSIYAFVFNGRNGPDLMFSFDLFNKVEQDCHPSNSSDGIFINVTTSPLSSSAPTSATNYYILLVKKQSIELHHIRLFTSHLTDVIMLESVITVCSHIVTGC